MTGVELEIEQVPHSPDYFRVFAGGVWMATFYGRRAAESAVRLVQEKRRLLTRDEVAAIYLNADFDKASGDDPAS